LAALLLSGSCGGGDGKGKDSGTDEPGGTTAIPVYPEAEELYGTYCGFCHGELGEGYVSDNANALANPNFLASADDEFLRQGILHGRPGTAMPGWGLDFGGPLVEDHVDAILSLIRSWQTEPTVTLTEGTIEGDPVAGATVYAEHCAECHGEVGEGGSFLTLNNPWFLHTATDGFLEYAIADGRPGTPMPGFSASLETQQINDIVALLRSWEVEVDDSPLPEFIPDWTDVVINPGGPPASFSPSDVLYVPADEVNAAIERGESLVVIDARPPSDYLFGHISGAVSVPFYDAATAAPMMPTDLWIVAYCGCPHAISTQAAEALLAEGLDTVGVIDEGYYHWIEQGYPVSRGRERYE
jgi:cytochrome c oxidase cbb3-type subunit 3/ubiquinol-cytochrome c reductase cytochrome c subunit